ncbi:outer membrane lipid asymmetry maintenance protein MlaD [Hydrogenophilus thiooxidans]|uniref:outer membrane lipid asymmetry maintenance protein MlaD n=1 Tax=Hydrogenophilus thiooxidans TaxID=2820326 RepID=UPI001C23F05D|nr:outer membrane lipid asymmetry maintenance protein MlaD [Hydrogenophilus thiooxidans]
MERKSWDVWVGLFVLLGMAALFFLAFEVSSAATSRIDGETIRVVAYFDNIGGLKVKAPVKSAGVLVGRVTAIRLDPKNYRAEVTMELSKRIPFPKDSSASILTAGLLGEQYVGIEAGADLENLQDGDRIVLTQSAVVLEKLIGQFLVNKAAE